MVLGHDRSEFRLAIEQMTPNNVLVIEHGSISCGKKGLAGCSTSGILGEVKRNYPSRKYTVKHDGSYLIVTCYRIPSDPPVPGTFIGSPLHRRPQGAHTYF